MEEKMRVIKGLVQDYGEEDKLVSSQSKRYSLRSTQARQLLGLKAEHAKRIKQNLGIDTLDEFLRYFEKTLSENLMEEFMNKTGLKFDASQIEEYKDIIQKYHEFERQVVITLFIH